MYRRVVEMKAFALISIFVACIGNARRTQAPSNQLQDHPSDALAFLILATRPSPVSAVLTSSKARIGTSILIADASGLHTRRRILQQAVAVGLANPALPIFAASDSRKASSPDEAKKQIAAGYEALGELLDNYGSVCEKEGGDGIRRVLGTVGTSSPVFLIESAFRLLFENDESLPMEYMEDVEKLKGFISDADAQAYSANFITFSSAKGTAEDYYKRARSEIVEARGVWKTLMNTLNM